jgi:surface protein
LATIKWGAIEDWDVSAVKNFDYALSFDRNEAGGIYDFQGNYQTKVWNAAGMEKWNTRAVTSMKSTFQYSFLSMTALMDLSGWDVAKVTNMHSIFFTAKGYGGLGLSGWDTSSVTTLESAFGWATKLSANLGTWDVSKSTTLAGAFDHASLFTG